jgi:hypothetical protein
VPRSTEEIKAALPDFASDTNATTPAGKSPAVLVLDTADALFREATTDDLLGRLPLSESGSPDRSNAGKIGAPGAETSGIESRFVPPGTLPDGDPALRRSQNEVTKRWEELSEQMLQWQRKQSEVENRLEQESRRLNRRRRRLQMQRAALNRRIAESGRRAAGLVEAQSEIESRRLVLETQIANIAEERRVFERQSAERQSAIELLERDLAEREKLILSMENDQRVRVSFMQSRVGDLYDRMSLVEEASTEVESKRERAARRWRRVTLAARWGITIFAFAQAGLLFANSPGFNFSSAPEAWLSTLVGLVFTADLSRARDPNRV